MKVQPFKVEIPQTSLDDLRERLARTRWPDSLASADWSYGSSLAYMKELVAYWGSYKPYLGSGADPLSPAEQSFLSEDQQWWDRDGAYAHIQRTKPQTLAYALNDSPAGLAGWVVEKFRDWSDSDGDIERCFTRDELLNNLALYWFTETFHSSTRLYNESPKRPLHFAKGERVEVPCGVARFAKEAPFPPREWVDRCYEVKRWTEFPHGGHFAALEEPKLLVDDIRAFFRPLR